MAEAEEAEAGVSFSVILMSFSMVLALAFEMASKEEEDHLQPALVAHVAAAAADFLVVAAAVIVLPAPVAVEPVAVPASAAVVVELLLPGFSATLGASLLALPGRVSQLALLPPRIGDYYDEARHHQRTVAMLLQLLLLFAVALPASLRLPSPVAPPLERLPPRARLHSLPRTLQLQCSTDSC